MAVKKKQSAEETVEEATRQAPETEEPIESVETTESEPETPEKAVKTPEEEEGEKPEVVPEEKDPRAFQARRQAEEIRRLKEELARNKTRESAFDALTPRVPQTVRQSPRAEQFMDTEGRIDILAFDEANRRWQETQAAIMQEGQREQSFKMEREFLKMKDPRLDEKNLETFDPKLEQRVADRYGRLAMEALYHGKPEPSLKQVYHDVLSEYGPTPKEKEKISQETLEKVSEKEQAASTSESPSTAPRAKGMKSSSSFEDLRQKTKQGNDEALAERLSKIPDQK